MDRRSLLRGALGVGLAAVTTKLWLPPVSTALAQPERTVFVPPAEGWLRDLGRAEIAKLFAIPPSLLGQPSDGGYLVPAEWLDELIFARPTFGELRMHSNEPGNHWFVAETSEDGGETWTRGKDYAVGDGVTLHVPVVLSGGREWRARQIT